MADSAEAIVYGMGTEISFCAYGANAESALKAAESETQRLEMLLSRFIPDSDISRINHASGEDPVKISEETLELLRAAVDISMKCDGSFDVTAGPITMLWHEARKKKTPPDKRKISRLLSLVDFKRLELDPSRRAVRLEKKGQSLDLGGIGKGYAADRVLEVFREHGITSAYTNFGGNVAVLGAKPDGSPWGVGIRHPRQQKNLVGAVYLTQGSVVTSGDYQRFFIGDRGRRYHHLIDLNTGYPAESGLLSATVVADSSMEADALSTMLFVSGMEEGLRILRAFSGAEAVLVDDRLSVYITLGLIDRFQAADGVTITVI